MKKRMYAVTLAASVVLTGCASVPDLSDKDSEMISQYIAGAVLNGSDNYKYAFNYDKSLLEPTPVPTPEPAPEPETGEQEPGSTSPGTVMAGNQGGSGNSQAGGSTMPVTQKASLSEVYNVTGINVNPVSYETKKNILTSYSSISADNGKKLVIVSFRFKNTSSGAKKVNLARKDISYSLTIGGESYGAPMFTIAEGDMLSFNEKIAAGKSKKGVLIFQVDSSVKVKNIVVKAVKGNKEATVSVK